MNDVNKYVDKLFLRHKQTQDIIDLKSELISNIEARIEDNMNNGLDYKAAFKEATRNIKTADSFVSTTKEINIVSFIKELAEISLILLLLSWIILTGIAIGYQITFTNILMLFGIACNIIIYIVISIINRQNKNHTMIINMAKTKKLIRIIWLLWGAYIIVKTGMTIVIRFGSNIWYGREINIDGPYQLYILGMAFILPLFSIIIPLLFNSAYKMISKHEVNTDE